MAAPSAAAAAGAAAAALLQRQLLHAWRQLGLKGLKSPLTGMTMALALALALSLSLSPSLSLSLRQGTGGTGGSEQGWSEHQTGDGRKFFHNEVGRVKF